jgi:hypothetical protein
LGEFWRGGRKYVEPSIIIVVPNEGDTFGCTEMPPKVMGGGAIAETRLVIRILGLG